MLHLTSLILIPWHLNCLCWIRVNLLWLNYPPWIDSSWLTLVWFDHTELELPYFFYKYVFDILGWGSFSWLFFMVVDYGCSYLWWWEIGKPWMLWYLNELYSWNTMILYGFCVNPRKLWCSSFVSTTWLYPRPAHKSWWWMAISRYPRGSRLPLHLVVGGR